MQIRSTWLPCFQSCILWSSFYLIKFQPACVTRFYEPRPSDIECRKWKNSPLFNVSYFEDTPNNHGLLLQHYKKMVYLIMSPVPGGTPNKFNDSEANQRDQNTISIRLACCVALLYFFCIVCIKEDRFYFEKSRCCSGDCCRWIHLSLFCFSLGVFDGVLNVI